MTRDVVIAYIPVLHDGYRRFIEAHARGRELFVVGPSLYADYRPLAKDIRCLDAGLVATAIDAWGICSAVTVLTDAGAVDLAASQPIVTLPAEDVSYQIVERYFARCEIRYDTVFLRWDKSKCVQLLPATRTAMRVGVDEADAALALAAETKATESVDWWRQVGAAIRFADGRIASASNSHNPDRLSPYAAGDPRSNFFKGVGIDISTATHAEARVIAEAARHGIAAEGAVMYVTDFPCPTCAKLIAAAGISKLYFREGYAVLDGIDVLESSGVEVARVAETEAE